jgi:hypothetical protein
VSVFLLMLGWSSAGTVASLGELRISGQDDHAMHVHGGAAAQLGQASFELKNSGPKTSLSVTKVEFLTGHDCEAAPETVQAEPGIVGLSLGEGQSPSKLLEVPKGKHDLKVHFAHVPAYYSHCDRFAFRVSFESAGESAVVVSETKVGREDPE